MRRTRRPILSTVHLISAGVASLTAGGAFASSAYAGEIRLDIDGNTTARTDMVATGYTQWPLNLTMAATNRDSSLTLSGVTFKISQSSPSSTSSTFYLDAVSSGKDFMSAHSAMGAPYKMAGDGVVVWQKDDTQSIDQPYAKGGALTLTITGLSTGKHTITTWHNNIWRHVDTFGKKSDKYGAMSKCLVSVGGSQVAQVTPSEYVTNDNNAAFAWFTVDATAGTPVVITFTPDHSGALDNVVINGIAVDRASPGAMASQPQPVDGDLHADCNNDAATAGSVAAGNRNLTWVAGASATKHQVYLGTNQAAVTAATTSSPEYKGDVTTASYAAKGLDSRATYYWRVDEVAGTTVSKGDTWTFKPRHLAYPGAVGYGRWSHSGRAGKVIEVTNLNDDGAGSLRDALLNHTGPRVVVFRTGGVIALKSKILIDAAHGDVYIAGQTAPGSGITLTQYNMGPSASVDITIRHVRERIGDFNGASIDGIGFSSSNHCLIDHCSVSWALDVGANSLSALNNTYSYNIIAEGLNNSVHYGTGHTGTERHSFAASFGGDRATIYKNLIVHNAGRNFSLAGGLEQDGKHYGGYLDIRNNVIYDWQGRTTDGGAKAVNFVGNYYKAGVNSTQWTLVSLDGDQLGTGDMQQLYVTGNKMQKTDGSVYLSPTSDNWKVCTVNYGTVAAAKSTSPLFPSDIADQAPDDIYSDVVANAGATRPKRDFLDTRYATETKNGTYTYTGSVDGLKGLIDNQDDISETINGKSVSGYALVVAKMDPGTAPVDTDHDGMPDAWETAHGLDPKNASDGNADPDGDGFTNLDDYLAYMAGDVKSVPIKTASGGDGGVGGGSGASGSGGAGGGSGGSTNTGAGGGTTTGSGAGAGGGASAGESQGGSGAASSAGGRNGTGQGGTDADGADSGAGSSGCSCNLADDSPTRSGLGLALFAAAIAGILGRRRRVA